MVNFEELWRILDEGYCFFEEKLPVGERPSWAEIRELYRSRVATAKSEDEFFDICNEMMGELRDGHVNLQSPFDVGGWDIRKGGRYCLNSSIRNNYLGTSSRRAGTIYYAHIEYNDHARDSIGYMLIPSFSSAISLAHLSAIFQRLSDCRGLIIDIRGNGGGLLSNASTMESVLISQESTVGYMSTKTGPGHQDFGPQQSIVVKPAPIRWLRPAVLLVDRGTYSAANSFSAYVKHTTPVTIIGDRTGGGGGLPYSSELPNGWWLRFSASRMSDARGNIIEFGVEPHIVQEQTDEATSLGQDALIERAIEVLTKASHQRRNKDL